MIADMEEPSNLMRVVLSCSAYLIYLNCNDNEVFLKSAEAGRGMKSECVSHHAPQSVAWDWRYK